MVKSIRIKHVITYIILAISSLTQLYSQVKSIGIPEVRNYPADQTLAGPQTWDIIEDRQGNIYFGNERGLCRFDGEEWLMIPLENNSEIHSLALGTDDKIYVGGYTEIGVVEKNSKGKPIYSSLNHLIPQNHRNFSVVWNIHQTRYGTIFQSYEYLFILNEDSITVLEPETSFGFSYYVNNKLYIIEKDRGLKLFTDDSLHSVSNARLFSNDEIRFILPFKSNDLLIGSFSNGLYILNEDGLKKWNVRINEEALSHNLYNGSVSGEYYIFGTVKNGLYIVNRSGEIVQHLNRSKGLQNNTVLSHFSDSKGNLWLGLDNGIDYLKTSLPISYINYNFNVEAVYSTIVYDDNLYVGTNQGLFMKPLADLSDPMNIEYEMVKNTEGQVWCLSIKDDQLLCGHNYGTFRIEENQAIKISETDGVWNFFSLKGIEDVLFSGSYHGLILYKKDNKGLWYQSDTINLDKSLRKIICDSDNNIWVNHDYEGIYKLRLKADLTNIESIEHYKDTAGLNCALPYSIHMYDNTLFVSTYEGNFVFDYIQNTFIPSPVLNDFFTDLGKISILEEDERGNVWYIAEKNTGLLKLIEDGSYINVNIPFKQIRSFLKDGYEHIYIQDQKNIFIASLHGLIHYDPTIKKDFRAATATHIKKVRIHSRNADSILSFMGNKYMSDELALETYNLEYNWNSIDFTFNCPDPENTDNIEYSFRLIGKIDEWSSWSTANRKEFNNLKNGTYTFEVRARNIYNNISEIDRFTFHIQTRFYKTGTAFIIYIVVFLLLITLITLYLRKKFENVRSIEEEKQTAAFQKKEEILKEEQEEAQREIERLKIDNLETGMKHKNKELANSTYHIIRKNKFLYSLKEELSKLSKAAKSEFVEQELKKISRKIDRDISNEKNWKVFDRYFDEVHQAFLNRVKEKHPDLSPKELRLSAYLKMNISTKEIAPLMNISIRGIEISRYRLRKKLGLDRDENLTQYLMDI